jgi:hypothetical protein
MHLTGGIASGGMKCQEFVDVELRDSYLFSNIAGAKKPKLE